MTTNQQRAFECWADSDPVSAIAAALDEAEARGRQSVGLGDFLPNPCGDEYSSYPHYIAETYGDYVTCSRSRGHDGQHEHQDSGMKWSTR